ncbi:hypothetical protein N9R81_05705 [Flavobacteriales bacterium]|nr:hypothetical protein [Flavobacteriales bacterium]
MSQPIDFMSKKKPLYQVNARLREYLASNRREISIPVLYEDLCRYSNSFPLLDKNDKDTLWEIAMYDTVLFEELERGLTDIYALLKTEGDKSVSEHLTVDRIDYCTFGNTNPFRIKIINKLNDNYDYFYVKRVDASRIYGLELEHILSPNRINYIVDKQTIVEEHIAGIPGDMFINDYLSSPSLNEVRLAKEFVKFNERCFVRLLGDMRSYNYVLDITPDFDNEQYRVRAIDFDQQSFEGKRTLYLPQYFKENNPMVNLCIKLLPKETVNQYSLEERTLIRGRAISARFRLKEIMDIMREEDLSIPSKMLQLKNELNAHYSTAKFDQCTTMGDIVRMNLMQSLSLVNEL